MVRVERIENAALWEAYAQTRARLATARGSANEVSLAVKCRAVQLHWSPWPAGAHHTDGQGPCQSVRGGLGISLGARVRTCAQAGPVPAAPPSNACMHAWHGWHGAGTGLARVTCTHMCVLPMYE